MSQRQDHEIIKIADDSKNRNDDCNESTQLFIEEKIPFKENLPHNGKPIIKMSISPQSKYVLTYSGDDKSFVGWLVNDRILTIDKYAEQLITDKNAKQLTIDKDAEQPTINKDAEQLTIDKDAESVTIDKDAEQVTIDKDAKQVTINKDVEQLTIDKDVKSFSEHDICDFKVSDEKVILYHYNNNNSGEVQIIIKCFKIC